MNPLTKINVFGPELSLGAPFGSPRSWELIHEIRAKSVTYPVPRDVREDVRRRGVLFSERGTWRTIRIAESGANTKEITHRIKPVVVYLNLLSYSNEMSPREYKRARLFKMCGSQVTHRPSWTGAKSHKRTGPVLDGVHKSRIPAGGWTPPTT